MLQQPAQGMLEGGQGVQNQQHGSEVVVQVPKKGVGFLRKQKQKSHGAWRSESDSVIVEGVTSANLLNMRTMQIQKD